MLRNTNGRSFCVHFDISEALLDFVAMAEAEAHYGQSEDSGKEYANTVDIVGAHDEPMRDRSGSTDAIGSYHSSAANGRDGHYRPSRTVSRLFM
jgi:hypothetical protein